MDELAAYCIFFSGLAAAMLFGFYGMANRRHSWLQEVSSFVISIMVGAITADLMSLLYMSLLYIDSLDGSVFLIYVFATSWATLTAAGPRIAYNSVYSQQFTVGFLLRLSAYCAIILLFNQIVEDFPFVALGLAIDSGF